MLTCAQVERGSRELLGCIPAGSIHHLRCHCHELRLAQSPATDPASRDEASSEIVSRSLVLPNARLGISAECSLAGEAWAENETPATVLEGRKILRRMVAHCALHTLSH